MFNTAGCRIRRGQTLDLTAQARGFLPSLSQAAEYDLVKPDGGLYLGDRSGDLSKARPEKLNTFVLVRQGRYPRAPSLHPQPDL